MIRNVNEGKKRLKYWKKYLWVLESWKVWWDLFEVKKLYCNINNLISSVSFSLLYLIILIIQKS